MCTVVLVHSFRLYTRRREYAYSSVEFTLETQETVDPGHVASFKGEPTQASEHALESPVVSRLNWCLEVFCPKHDTTQVLYEFSPRDTTLFSSSETMLLTSPFPYSCLTPLRTSDKLSHMHLNASF